MRPGLVSPSVPPTLRARSLRPWYVSAALVLALLIGLRGLGTGCGATLYLRDGTVPDVTAVAEQARGGEPFELTFQVIEAAQARALAEHRHRTFPLSVGRTLLGGLLLVASFMALGGRRGSRTLMLQAIGAGVAFAAIDYGMTREVRAAWIDMVVRAGALLPEGSPERQSVTTPALWWFAERVRVSIFEIGALLLIAVALSRARAEAWFQAMEDAVEEETEEP